MSGGVSENSLQLYRIEFAIKQTGSLCSEWGTSQVVLTSATAAHCSKEPGLNTVDSAAPSFLMQICHQFQEPWTREVVVGPT